MSILKGKRIVLGVTGSIACYRALDVASKLTQEEALVDVVLTESAAKFLYPLTFRSLTHRSVVTDLFDPDSEYSEHHVRLAEAADLVLIVPATANTIAKLAAGIADDMLGCTVLATEAPVLIAPAMDYRMWRNTITQDNVAKMRERGFSFVGPVYGRLASGAFGEGRLADVDTIIGAARQALGRNGDLAGRRIVVSAGGTQEPLDPARYIGNYSSGKMGYSIAEAARDRGAGVTLVVGPTALPDPAGIAMVKVRTTVEMRDAVASAVTNADALIMAAAPADYRPAARSEQKMKRHGEDIVVHLVENPDILAEVNGPFVKVGFAAESQDLLQNAREKLRRKKLDLIVANDITASDAG
ncbi:MAG: bifunctional phosphopantothenoylcysteine decarboxylase/phosphopantothenate--cysteine ligase CoaBC, partial [Chloroflexi bacterium]|nr:bifunctional phosphopantothenoylcysteine decarboxylase/phosphopantothenate--cysteine ligase CoaBC [Chloroflexota bacterium]